MSGRALSAARRGRRPSRASPCAASTRGPRRSPRPSSRRRSAPRRAASAAARLPPGGRARGRDRSAQRGSGRTPPRRPSPPPGRCGAPRNPLAGLAAPGVVDQDAPHDPGREGEEMRPILPSDAAQAPELEERFVDESGRLQGVTGPFASQLLRGDGPELAVDRRDETLQSLVVPLFQARSSSVTSESTGGTTNGNLLNSPLRQSYGYPHLSVDRRETFQGMGRQAKRNPAGHPFQVPGGR